MAPATDVLRTAIGDIEIVYDVIGQPTNPPLLLISGMGAQLIDWHEDFCQELVDLGLFVIRFDNRDVGLSSHLDGAVPPDLATATDCDQWKSPYALTDMAADAAGLIHNLRARIGACRRHLPWRNDRPNFSDSTSRPSPEPDLHHVHDRP